MNSNLENFWPRTLRENYLHQNYLQLLDHVEDLEEERDNLLSVRDSLWNEKSQFLDQRKELYSQISIRDEIIKDLNLKLQKENENSQNWKNKMLEEEKEKNLVIESAGYTRK